MLHFVKLLACTFVLTLVALGSTPKVGERAPQFSLASADGRTVALKDYVGKKLVLVFYRGYWWPFCRKQLAGLAADYDKIKAAGADVVAISVDKPEKSRELSDKLKLLFSVLSDVDHKVIDAYGLFNADGKISKPATFVLDATGVVRWSFFEEDYKIRPIDDVILEELSKLK
jgi:peroxiredoxin